MNNEVKKALINYLNKTLSIKQDDIVQNLELAVDKINEAMESLAKAGDTESIGILEDAGVLITHVIKEVTK